MTLFSQEARINARLLKHQETVKHIRSNGHRNPKGEGRKVQGKTARNFHASLDKNNQNMAEVFSAHEGVGARATEKRRAHVRDIAQDIVKDFDDSTLRDLAQKVMADGRLTAREIMEMFETMEDVTVAHLADAKAIAIAHSDELNEQMRKVTTALEQETHKIIKNASRFATNLEDMGVLNKHSAIENLKHGSIHIRNHYINLGAVLISLILMKSMRFVVAVNKDDESDDKELSVSGFTDWLKGDGQSTFGANAKVKALSTFVRGTQTVPGAVIVVNKTPDKLINLTQAELVDDQFYIVVLCDVSSAGGGTLNACNQQLLSGAELKDALSYVFLATSAWTLAGVTSTAPTSAFAQDGKATVITCQAVQATSEDVRIAGGLDLAGAAKVAAWMVGTNFSDWASVITPFFSNTIGNLVTKNKLFDFLGDKDA